jgi:hypothetical protein
MLPRPHSPATRQVDRVGCEVDMKASKRGKKKGICSGGKAARQE